MLAGVVKVKAHQDLEGTFPNEDDRYHAMGNAMADKWAVEAVARHPALNDAASAEVRSDLLVAKAAV